MHSLEGLTWAHMRLRGQEAVVIRSCRLLSSETQYYTFSEIYDECPETFSQLPQRAQAQYLSQWSFEIMRLLHGNILKSGFWCFQRWFAGVCLLNGCPLPDAHLRLIYFGRLFCAND